MKQIGEDIGNKQYLNFLSPLCVSQSESDKVINIINNHLVSLDKAFLIYFPEI